MPKKKKHKRPKARLSRADWIAAARAALIAGGVGGVNVHHIANALKVTRGSFYHHFKSHEELLDALLHSWENETNDCFLSVLNGELQKGMGEFLALCNLWLEEDRYSPAYDAAIRDWARTSKSVADAVRRVDRKRIDIIKQIFRNMDFDDDEAYLRARLTYFAQVGHYTVGLDESKAARRERVPFNISVMTGRKPTP